MIKFYSNENLAMDLVEAIRHRGYDVLTSYEAQQANQGIPDDEVLRYAMVNHRCVLTFNRGDFLTYIGVRLSMGALSFVEKSEIIPLKFRFSMGI